MEVGGYTHGMKRPARILARCVAISISLCVIPQEDEVPATCEGQCWQVGSETLTLERLYETVPRALEGNST
jgi:hypothetical protein